MKRLAGVAVIFLAACTTNQTIDTDLASAIAKAEPGSVLELQSTSYSGPLVIEKPLTIIGAVGTTITAPTDVPAISIVGTSDVTIRGLRIEGGKSGILVQYADRVILDDVELTGALWHGIVAQNSEIIVTDCIVTGLEAPLSQGVEIINSDSKPASLVSGCRIEGPVFEGLVAHVSHVTFEDNVVIGSTARGVVITEMSDGEMVGNTVADSFGNAFFCGDMSNCSIVDNVANRIAPGDPHRSAQGHGVVVHYHSNAYVAGFESDGLVGEAVLLMLDSHLLESTPYP